MRTRVELTHTTAKSVFKHLMNYEMLLDILTADKNDPRYKWMTDLRENPEDLKRFIQGLASKQHDIHLRRDTVFHAILQSGVKDGIYQMEEKEKDKFLKSRASRTC